MELRPHSVRNTLTNAPPKVRKAWKSKFLYWVLGFNNTFGFAAVVTAAKDILRESFPQPKYRWSPRQCSFITTGLILVMLVSPALIVHRIQACVRNAFESLMVFSLVVTTLGYIALAFPNEPFSSLPGVLCISVGFSISDYQLTIRSKNDELKYAKKFPTASGLAVVIGSLHYTILSTCGVELTYIFLSMISVPFVTAIVFWCLFRSISSAELRKRADSQFSLTIFNSERKLITVEDKSRYIMHVIRNSLPLAIVVFLDGLINQGIYEFIYFRGNIIDIYAQYRVYICIYFMGFYACFVVKLFIFRNRLWIFIVFQFLISGFFMCDAIWFFSRFLGGNMILTYLQGISTGIAYTSARERLLSKEPSNYLELAEITQKMLIFFVLMLSGICGLGVHYFLSQYPEPSRP